MQELNREDKFYQLMQKGKLHLHSDELEDNIMQEILRRDLYKKRVYKSIKISLRLLILTTVLGFSLSSLSGAVNILPTDSFWLFQIILLSTFLFLVDNLINFFKQHNKFPAS